MLPRVIAALRKAANVVGASKSHDFIKQVADIPSGALAGTGNLGRSHEVIQRLRSKNGVDFSGYGFPDSTVAVRIDMYSVCFIRSGECPTIDEPSAEPARKEFVMLSK